MSNWILSELSTVILSSLNNRITGYSLREKGGLNSASRRHSDLECQLHLREQASTESAGVKPLVLDVLKEGEASLSYVREGSLI